MCNKMEASLTRQTEILIHRISLKITEKLEVDSLEPGKELRNFHPLVASKLECYRR